MIGSQAWLGAVTPGGADLSGEITVSAGSRGGAPCTRPDPSTRMQCGRCRRALRVTSCVLHHDDRLLYFGFYSVICRWKLCQ